jgi:hypothetical protein
MDRTDCVLVVNSARVFSCLKGVPIIDWVVSELYDVRGLGKITCVSVSRLRARAEEALRSAEIPVLSLPRELTDLNSQVFDNWLVSHGPVAGADIVTVVRPVHPLMPGAKIETCIEKVKKKKVPFCSPAREVVLSNVRRITTNARTEGVRVFRPGNREPNSTVGVVAVNLMESLNVDNHDEYVLIDALVASGKVKR